MELKSILPLYFIDFFSFVQISLQADSLFYGTISANLLLSALLPYSLLLLDTNSVFYCGRGLGKVQTIYSPIKLHPFYPINSAFK